MNVQVEGFVSSHPGDDAVMAAGHAASQKDYAFAFEISPGQWLVYIYGLVMGFRKEDA